jgi:hypothetical protein
MIYVLSILLFFFQVNSSLAVKEKEILVIYIGSSECSFCNSEENKKHYRLIKSKIKNKTDIKLKTVGISLDKSIEDGYNFLTSLDDFDEVIIGEKQINTGYLKYVLENYKGVEIIPQVLIVLKTLNDENNRIEKEELLYRVVGTNKMEIFTLLLEEIDFNKFY